MADATRVAGKSQLISMLSQRVRVGTPDSWFFAIKRHSKLLFLDESGLKTHFQLRKVTLNEF